MTDRNGRPIEVGDRVTVEFTVTDAFDGPPLLVHLAAVGTEVVRPYYEWRTWARPEVVEVITPKPIVKRR